jgi:hypothetical protein
MGRPGDAFLRRTLPATSALPGPKSIPLSHHASYNEE